MNSRMYNKHQLEYLEQVNEGILGTALKGAALAGGAYLGYKGLKKLGSGSVTGALGGGSWADKAKNLGTSLAGAGARREKGGQGASGALMKGAGIALGRLGKSWAKSKPAGGAGSAGGALSYLGNKDKDFIGGLGNKASSGTTAKPTPPAAKPKPPTAPAAAKPAPPTAPAAAKPAPPSSMVRRGVEVETRGAAEKADRDKVAGQLMKLRAAKKSGQRVSQSTIAAAQKTADTTDKPWKAKSAGRAVKAAQDARAGARARGEQQRVARRKQKTVQKAAAGGAGTVAGQKAAETAAARTDKTTAGMMDFMNK